MYYENLFNREKKKTKKVRVRKRDYYGNYYDSYDDDIYKRPNYGASSGNYYNTYGNFNWGNYTLNSFKEDNSQLVIREDPSYDTPTVSQINKKLYSRSHYNFRNVEDVVKNISRYFYNKMFENNEEMFQDKYLDKESLNESDLSKVLKYENIIQSIESKSFIPGSSPLDKAINIIESIYNEIDKKKCNNEDYYSSGDMEEDMVNLIDNCTVDNPIYSNPVLKGLVKDITRKDDVDFSILNKISIIDNFGKKFEIEKEIKEKQVNNSRITALKRMQDISQVQHVELYQKLMPNFRIKLITKDLNITVPVIRKENKQKIIILVDRSGSMQDAGKQDWVAAILADRFRYAVEEECEIFISYFLSESHGLHFHHLYNEKTVNEFIKDSYIRRPDGGGTEFGKVVNNIAKEIPLKTFFNLKKIDLSEDKDIEILGIADGDDSVYSNEFHHKTNAISLMRANSQLKDMCLENKGKYVHVERTGRVHEYE